jgi:hypothetical protein
VAERDCLREDEVVDVVSAGRWPDGCEGELRDHVATCAHCGELAMVASAILDDRNAAIRFASIPPSGAVWWRVQMRAYQDAQRAAAQTVTLVQAVALLAALAVAAAILGTQVLATPIAWLGRMSVTIPAWTVPLAVAMLVVTIPAAVWLALAKE